MSYNPGPRRKSEHRDQDSGSYNGAGFFNEDDEEHARGGWFPDDGDVGSGLSDFPWPSTSTDRQREADDREAEGLSFALSERMELLQSRIETLQKNIIKRGTLHRSIRRAIEDELTELGHLLSDVKVWSLGVNASVDSRRTNLEREAIALKKTGWEERLRHWRDIVSLEKELADALERYALAGAARGLTGDGKGKK